MVRCTEDLTSARLIGLGVDACNTFFEVLLFAAAMTMGQSWYTVLTLFGCKSTLWDITRYLQYQATFTFYIQTWDEYYTQTLILGIVSGPVEGILTLCIVYAVTGYIGGGSYWQGSAMQALGLEKHSAIPELIYNLSWNEWWIFYGGVVLVFNTVSRYARCDHSTRLNAVKLIGAREQYQARPRCTTGTQAISGRAPLRTTAGTAHLGPCPHLSLSTACDP